MSKYTLGIRFSSVPLVVPLPLHEAAQVSKTDLRTSGFIPLESLEIGRYLGESGSICEFSLVRLQLY